MVEDKRILGVLLDQSSFNLPLSFAIVEVERTPNEITFIYYDIIHALIACMLLLALHETFMEASMISWAWSCLAPLLLSR